VLDQKKAAENRERFSSTLPVESKTRISPLKGLGSHPQINDRPSDNEIDTVNNQSEKRQSEGPEHDQHNK
jgi:hypothetical protein